MVGIGYEVKVEWLPGTIKHRNGRRLEEEVIEDIIFIYSDDEYKALKLLRHVFAECMLGQYSRPYRQLIKQFHYTLRGAAIREEGKNR